MRRAGAAPGSYNEKRLKNIVDNHPRDELFQISEDELLVMAQGILHLADRPRVRVFERRDPFDRFVSVILYVPRDRYNSDVRKRAGEILLPRPMTGGCRPTIQASTTRPLARVHFIIGLDRGTTPRGPPAPGSRRRSPRPPAPGRTASTRRCARSAATPPHGRADRPATATPSPPATATASTPHEALADVAEIEAFRADHTIARGPTAAGDGPLHFRFKLYRRNVPAPLADVLPILENMGLKAMDEAASGSRSSRQGRDPVWAARLRDRGSARRGLDLRRGQGRLRGRVVAVWSGRSENDGFNRLVVELSIPWRDAALVRSLARYRQQSGLDPSQRVQEEALSNHPGVTRDPRPVPHRFDPAIAVGLEARKAQAAAVMGEIVEALQAVESLDDDRVLRRLGLLVGAIQRTNFYQRGALTGR